MRVLPNLIVLYEYRELIYFLALRDIKLKYKQTLLGILWVLIQPILTVVMFTIFLGRLIGVPSDDLPYPLFAMCALVPWQLFVNTFSYTANSLVHNRHIITKVYFPAMVVPFASIASHLVDFFVTLLALFIMTLLYGVPLTPALLLLPLFVVLAVVAAAGMGLWLSALNARFRDVHHTLPFLTQVLLFASPIAYPSSLVPPAWRGFLGLNPVAGVIEGFRWAMLGDHFHSLRIIGLSTLSAVLIFVTGLMMFSRLQESFADVI